MRSLRRNESYRKAKEFFDQQEYKKAIILLNEIIEEEKDDKTLLAKTYFLMANIFHLKGEVGKAIKGFKLNWFVIVEVALEYISLFDFASDAWITY